MPNKQSHHNTYFGDSLHDSTDGFTLVKLRRLHPSNKFQSKCKTQPTYHSSHIALQSNKSRKSNTVSLTKKSHIHQKRKSILPLFTSHSLIQRYQPFTMSTSPIVIKQEHDTASVSPSPPAGTPTEQVPTILTITAHTDAMSIKNIPFEDTWTTYTHNVSSPAFTESEWDSMSPDEKYDGR